MLFLLADGGYADPNLELLAEEMRAAMAADPQLATVVGWYGNPEELLEKHFAELPSTNKLWDEAQERIEPMKLRTTRKLEILPLVDFAAVNDELQTEPGVSYLIQTDHETILFDLGLNYYKTHPSPLLKNMESLGVSLDEIDALVISHNHLDHVGGKSWSARNTFAFTHKIIDISHMEIYTPVPMTYKGTNPILCREPMKIGRSVATTGTIPSQHLLGGITHEQAMAINVKNRGIVLILGCGHQSVTRLIERAEALFEEPIYGVIGGLHYPLKTSRLYMYGVDVARYLGTGKLPWKPIALDDVTRDISLLVKHNLGIVSLSPHDSADESIEAFRSAFPAAYVDLTVGGLITITHR
jgi:7,8-dihydropterin-6-yl-methyl-4-(beta-D-ribofuranosyl)aminobenzene 5'-phosphate synthase